VQSPIVTGTGSGWGTRAATASGVMDGTGAGQAMGVQTKWQLAAAAAQSPKAIAIGPNSTQTAKSTRLRIRRPFMTSPVDLHAMRRGLGCQGFARRFEERVVAY